MDDRLVGDTRSKRIVFCLVLGLSTGALFGFIGALAGFGTGLLCRSRRRPDSVLGNTAATRLLGEPFELVCGAINRLQVALMFKLPASGCDVRVPAFGHAPAGKLDGALVKRRFHLQQEKRLLYIKYLD